MSTTTAEYRLKVCTFYSTMRNLPAITHYEYLLLTMTTTQRDSLAAYLLGCKDTHAAKNCTPKGQGP